MKFAYLIIAHGNYKLLKMLVSALDDKRNDIFIHFDARVETVNLPITKSWAKYSTVNVIENRVRVSWGGIGLVKATFALLNAAKTYGNYDYYHTLSGVDFPIKSNDYIQSFFRDNQGREFISFDPYYSEKILKNRVLFYHFVDGNMMRKSKTMYRINQLLVAIQRLLQFTRKPIEPVLCGGSNWFSITEDLVIALLNDEDRIIKAYSYTFCSDEVVVQTFVRNHMDFNNRVYRNEKYGNMRYIVFDNYGACQTWKYDQFDVLIKSPYLFARKFSEKELDLVEKLCSVIK